MALRTRTGGEPEGGVAVTTAGCTGVLLVVGGVGVEPRDVAGTKFPAALGLRVVGG